MFPEPKATYRLQLRPGFGFEQVIEILRYLADLGVSHVYTSPFLQAVQDSTSGYDIVDPTRINAQLGNDATLDQLCQALHEHGLGLMVDIVPNHMSISKNNIWWWDVLKNGPSSPFAKYFDIHWGDEKKVLLPILDDSYPNVLKKGEFELEQLEGEMLLHYHEHTFPISKDTSDNLDESIQKQHYRLEWWGTANQKLNYRRFFDITHLAGLCVEEEEVFQAVHQLPLEWYAKGWVQGIRVDHPDGLYNPSQYFARLKRMFPKVWIIAEKILVTGEKIPTQWEIAGTTGYDFLNLVNELFVNPQAKEPFTALYSEITGKTEDFSRLVYTCKLLALERLFASEVNWLTDLLAKITAKYQREELRTAICQIAACFPAYRSYIAPHHVSSEDAAFINLALQLALEKKSVNSEILHLIKDLLFLHIPGSLTTEFTMRFQQLTGPAMAKGFEDTALYRYNRYIALNEVGGDPGSFGITLNQFHESCLAKQNAPYSLLASSTHDTKRSEDVRARLALLSEIPEDFGKAVKRWISMHKKFELDANTQYFFYQTVIGAWPIDQERLTAYMLKAVREAKEHTDWLTPSKDYEQKLLDFVHAVLHDPIFRADFENFVAPLIHPGRLNSLAQTLIKLTAPGVPDIYQGCELWNLNLVDPDNRRAVDYALRQKLLHEIQDLSPEQMMQRMDEGLPKLWLIQQTLLLRRRKSFNTSYIPLYAEGKKADHVVAFFRGESIISLSSRFNLRLNRDWDDTYIKIPETEWINALTGEKLKGGKLFLSPLLKTFPVALLEKNL